MHRGSLFADLSASLKDELVTRVLLAPDVRVERIVSRGHVSPPDFWYDQDEHELVVIVQGHARLEIEGHGEVTLLSGDWLHIQAHVRHRVTFTAPEVDTIWLAVFHTH